MTVTGSFNNESGAQFGVSGVTTVGALTNAGTIQVGAGSTLNAANGLTTIAAGSEFDLLGKFNSGGQSGLANLTSIVGALAIANGQALTITPSSGTLDQGGALFIGSATSVTVQGNLTNHFTQNSGFDNLFGVGGLTNEGALSVTGDLNNSTAMTLGGTLNAGTFENSGNIEFDPKAPQSATIDVAGAYTQTGGALSLTFLPNSNDIVNASTINIQAGQFAVTEFSANTIMVGSATLQGTLVNIGGGPIAPETPVPSKPLVTIATNGTLIDNGTATFGFSGAPGTVNNAGSVTVGAGGTLDTAGGSYNQSAGTTQVNGTLIANLTIAGGKLSGTGTIKGSLMATGGMIEPSDPLTVSGSFTLSPNGAFAEDISSATDFGALDVTGTASLGGALDISLLSNFVPGNGEQFIILEAQGGLSGMFSSISGLNFGPGGADQWKVSYSSNSVILTAATPEPGSLALLGIGMLALALLLLKKPRMGHMTPPALRADLTSELLAQDTG